jgi:DNA repair exonuclease SbcCD nuclease subunit
MTKPLVVCADLHIHPYKLCSNDGGRDRLADGLSALEQSLQLALEQNALWVFAGDMKQPRTIWSQEAQNGVLDCFRRFEAVPKLLLPGNHDGPRLPGGSGLQAFASEHNCKLVEKPTLLPGWAPGLAVWPCEADEAGLENFVEQAVKNGCHLLLSHGLLEGCRLSPDIKAPTGLTPERFGIGKASPAFALSIFGDVHRGQIFREQRKQWRWEPFDELLQFHAGQDATDLRIAKSFNGQIIYPGDPYQQNWGEAGESPKGVLLVEPDEQNVYFSPISGPEFIVADWTEATSDAFEASFEKLAKGWQGNFVKLILAPWGSERSIQSLLKNVKERFGIRSFQCIVQRPVTVETRSAVHAAMDKPQLLREFMTARPPEDGLDREAMLTAGIRLMGDEE